MSARRADTGIRTRPPMAAILTWCALDVHQHHPVIFATMPLFNRVIARRIQNGALTQVQIMPMRST